MSYIDRVKQNATDLKEDVVDGVKAHPIATIVTAGASAPFTAMEQSWIKREDRKKRDTSLER